jgi:hypothetical protein
MLLEENVFDHNGWYRQAGPDPEDLPGAATLFNHNTYFVDQRNTTARGNIFLRPSSIGTKWTANSGPASASNIVIDDNLYVDCEVGIGIGGNDREHPYRFKNVRLTNNVITDLGRSRPTNRALGWCIDVDDWDGGEVARNLCIRQNNPELKLTRGLFVDGTTRNVLVRDNVIFGLSSNKPLVVLTDGSTKENVTFVDNVIEGVSPTSALFEIIGSAQNYVFQNNSLYSTAKPSRWFKIDGKGADFQAWTEKTGASDTNVKVSFPDSSRSIEAYQRTLGGPATMDAFIEEVRKQSKYSWRSAYTASEVNAWIRAGFGL